MCSQYYFLFKIFCLIWSPHSIMKNSCEECLLLNILRSLCSHDQSVNATWLVRRTTNECLHRRILKARPHSSKQAVYLSCAPLIVSSAHICVYYTHSSWNWATENYHALYAHMQTENLRALKKSVRVISSNKILWVLRANKIVYYNFSQPADGNNSTTSGNHCFCCALASKYQHAATRAAWKTHVNRIYKLTDEIYD